MFTPPPHAIRPFNNDRTAHLAAFRFPAREGRPLAPTACAAPALEPIAPRPLRLDDEQAETALAAVHQEVSQRPAAAQAHSGLDAERVARLLDLLE